MAEIVVPNEKLIELRRKLYQAKTVAERTKIAEEITALESTLMSEPSNAAIIEVSRGGLSPAVATPESFKGKTILSPSTTKGIYWATKYDPVTGAATDLSVTDTGVTQFGAQASDKKLVYYDAKGKPISSSELAQTQEGKSMAAAGYDIGYGPGKVGPGASDYATGYRAPGTTDYNVMMGLDPLTGQPIEEVVAGRAKYTDPRSGKVVTTDASGKLVFADGTPYTGSSSTLTSASATGATTETQSKRESAFAVLKKEFDKYGLGSLVDSVKNLILTGSPPEEVVLKLRETPEYLKRFAGNKLRLDAGLNVYDEATYLDLENAYDQIFTSYGVEEAVGNTRDARRAKYAEFIGGTKSPDEIKGRVQLAVLASQEDAVTKATMKELYPMITDKDLVSYFLNPKETLPKLETKIRAAQVGAAAVRQGLVTNVATAEELVGLGITEEQAEKGYAAYAGMKPRLDFLSSLEKDQQSIVDQQVAEGALLKNLASEQRKILNLQQKEEGRFGGASGAARGVSLSKQLGGTY